LVFNFPSTSAAYNEFMPRTFSLARLMLGITLFCILCGLAVNYSEMMFAYVLICASFLPTAIVCLTLVSFSRRRKTVLILSILGAFVPVLPGPAVMHTGPEPLTVWQAINGLWPFAILPPLGALLFGGAALLNDFSSRQSTPHDERLDQDREIQRLLRR